MYKTYHLVTAIYASERICYHMFNTDTLHTQLYALLNQKVMTIYSYGCSHAIYSAFEKSYHIVLLSFEIEKHKIKLIYIYTCYA